jgi:hypothetical protein
MALGLFDGVRRFLQKAFGWLLGVHDVMAK